ncbi:MAG TPA: TMEM175 family protein [Candidatus Dormibacteraeota bacterium]|nr:TMEM175 family protein [Candidatus Dormibacteraeota bacterium]
MPKNRLEAFADGIFAFAATLLILNLAVLEGKPLGGQLLGIWTSYVAYAISFVTIGIIWMNHHLVMHQVARTDRLFLVLNILFLMVIAFIPFPTRLLALYIDSPDAEAAALAYGITLTLTAVLFNALWRYAAWGRRLIREDADQRVVSGISRSYVPGPIIYFVATVVALISPWFSAALYGLIALFYVLESSVFGRSAST